MVAACKLLLPSGVTRYHVGPAADRRRGFLSTRSVGSGSRCVGCHVIGFPVAVAGVIGMVGDGLVCGIVEVQVDGPPGWALAGGTLEVIPGPPGRCRLAGDRGLGTELFLAIFVPDVSILENLTRVTEWAAVTGLHTRPPPGWRP